MAANLMKFGSELVGCCRQFGQGPAKKWTWHGRDGPPGACFTSKHHSLVTYGGHGMVQQQQMRCHGRKQHELWLDGSGWMIQNDWQSQAKKWTWLGRDGPPGACFTAKHHPLVSYGGHGMVQKQQMRCHGCKPHEFWPRAGWMLRNFWQNRPKNGVGLAEMGHQELVSQQNITHWSHMEDME